MPLAEPDEESVEWSEGEIPPQFREDESEPAEGKKRCPTCQNEISEEAIRCLFCGRHVPVHSGFMSALLRYPPRAVGTAAALIALFTLLIWLIL